MTRIREFTAGDIPRVADIHRRAFEIAPAMTPELLDEYGRWLTSVFLEPPTRAPGRQESLVGSVFEGSIEIAEGSNGAVIPSIKGSAYVNSEADLILDEHDPFCMGIRA